MVTIFSRADLDLPIEKHASFVRVGGEVNAPGVYRVNPGETLRDVVEAAGGLTPHSYLYASILTRVSTRHAQEEELRQATEQMQRELVRPLCECHSNCRSNRGRPTSAACFSADRPGPTVFDQTDRPGGSGIEAGCRNRRGHSRTSRLKMETLSISRPGSARSRWPGSVYNANAFRHQPEKRLIAYLNDAGGATREADRKAHLCDPRRRNRRQPPVTQQSPAALKS